VVVGRLGDDGEEEKMKMVIWMTTCAVRSSKGEQGTPTYSA
jgi:hypothetical protein